MHKNSRLVFVQANMTEVAKNGFPPTLIKQIVREVDALPSYSVLLFGFRFIKQLVVVLYLGSRHHSVGTSPNPITLGATRLYHTLASRGIYIAATVAERREPTYGSH